jgi:hypothetical protein
MSMSLVSAEMQDAVAQQCADGALQIALPISCGRFLSNFTLSFPVLFLATMNSMDLGECNKGLGSTLIEYKGCKAMRIIVSGAVSQATCNICLATANTD